jgi:hypothetical protein
MHLNKFLKGFLPLSLLAIVIMLATSCKKDKVLTSGGQVSFSIDTLMFDTVFTQQGSSTRSLLIYNKQKEKITLSSIRLKNGTKSSFRLNVNGYPGTEIDNVDIAGNDSVWVFAAVTVDPNDSTKPFVVDDQLIATLNGQDFSIPVMAYGQNAYYIRDSTLETQTWRTDKPYVILQNAYVDEGATLTIPAGAKVYMHQDSRLFVLGSLKINGTQSDSVIFQGDRLDPLVWIGDYIDIPGQWGGLYFFNQSHDNVINYAVFKNGGAATNVTINNQVQSVQGAVIQCDSNAVPSVNPKLKLTNTVIRTSSGYGVLAYNSTIDMENCRVVECAAENICFFQGGKYHVYDCTVGTYGSEFLSHTDHLSMAVLNYLPIDQNTYFAAPLTADIKNVIVYGSLQSEIFFDSKPDFTSVVSLTNCLVKTKDAIPAFVTQLNNIINQDPLFKDYTKGDYHLQSGSPAAGHGIAAGTINTDLDGVIRANPPSIGCYEFTP